MLRKITMTLFIISMAVSASSAATANDYLTTGRAQLFNGTLSGVRLAYQTFDTGIKNNACADCASSRELKFFRAVAGMAMLFAKDDGGSIDSVIELLKSFDIETLGQYWAPYYRSGGNGLNFNAPTNQRDAYEFPADAPTWAQIGTILDSAMLPKIDSIIADLDAVTDTPTVFKVLLTPAEIRMLFRSDSDVLDPFSPDYDPASRFLSPLELDRGEVYLLRAAMYFIKSQLQARNAYDTAIADMDSLVKKGYGDWFGINKDLLTPYPNFLKVAPTANNTANGKTILAQAKQNLLNAINNCIDGITYIQNENIPAGTDPQDNELLYIDPQDAAIAINVMNRFTALRNSLTGDTAGTYPIQTTKTYNLLDGSSSAWQLKLNYNLFGDFDDNDYGTFISTNSSAPRYWTIEYAELSGNTLMIDLDCAIPSIWASGYFTATLSSNGQTISGGSFDYWGSQNGSRTNLSGSLNATTVNNQKLDLNPIYGSTGRYPNPVVPRNILPQFDELNAALPGTVGSGLTNDATLGGILPERTQTEWQMWFDLPPAGTKAIKSATALPIVIDGSTAEWSTTYRLFTDPQGDHEVSPPSASMTGVDMAETYLASDPTYLYGAVKFYDNIVNNNYYDYGITLSYTPFDDSTLHTIDIHLNVSSGGVASCNLWYMDDANGWPHWEFPATDIQCAKGTNAVEFKVSLSQLPGTLDGRYVIVESDGWTQNWSIDGGDYDWTHIKIGQTGSISGAVAFNGPVGQAISVQAFTDLNDPDNSVVAKTVINGAGLYTLAGIGRGWSGYIRAFTPVFGFDNPFELDGFAVVSDAVAVTLPAGSSSVAGKNLVMTMPIVLYNGVSVAGNLDTELEEMDQFAFIAVKGSTYTFELNGNIINSDPWMSLLDRNASDNLSLVYDWDNWGNPSIRMEWTCQMSGTYFVELEAWGLGGSYQLKMTASVPLIRGSISPDFDGTVKTDILWRRTTTGNCLIQRMNGVSTIGRGTIGGDLTWDPIGLGDFNSDNKTDILWRRSTTGSCLIQLMNGTSTISRGIIGGDLAWEPVGLGDFSGDGKTDILWRNNITGISLIQLMNGTSTISRGTVGGDLAWDVVDLGDFNGDNKVDILWRRTTTGSCLIQLMNGVSTIGRGTVGGDLTWVPWKLGDFDNDLKMDILWRRTTTGNCLIQLMNGLSTKGRGTIGGDLTWEPWDLGDFNGDNKTDILWRRTTTGSCLIQLMNGVSTMSRGTVGGDLTWEPYDLGDFNGDNKMDILWRRTTTGSCLIQLMNGVSTMSRGTVGGDLIWEPLAP
jgi:hypothetical protein